MKPFLFSLLGIVIAFQASFAAQTDTINLVVMVDGAQAEKGQIIASLFDGEQNHMSIPASEITKIVDQDGRCEIIFRVSKPGFYSVSIIYDLDKDGELDTGMFGIPKEKIGFSNNARGRMGPAEWGKARFKVSEDPTIIEISLADAK